MRRILREMSIRMPVIGAIVPKTALMKRDAALGGGMLRSWLGRLRPPLVDYRFAWLASWLARALP